MSENLSNLPAGGAPLLVTEPLLVLDTRASEVVAAMARRDLITAAARGEERGGRSRYSVQGNAAVVSIAGPLLNFGDIDLSDWGYTSYGWLSEALRQAGNDTAVSRVITAFDSPGGMVAGIEGATDAFRSLKAQKPVIAHVEGMAASAAYWLASQANEIVMTDLSEVGSIGVYTAHYDYSKLLDRIGLNISLISSGRHKVEGNPFEALPADVRERIQSRVDDLRVAFAQEVAAGRPNLSAEAAMATEARMYRGKVRSTGASEAIEAGLADKLGSLASILSTKTARSRASTGTKGASMSGQTEGGPAAENAGISQAQHDAGLVSARVAAKAEGIAEANTRLAAIFATDGVKGSAARMQAAADLAVKAPGMSAEDVAAFVTGSVPATSASNSLSERDHPANALGGNPPPAADAVKSGWSKAAARINDRI